MCIYHFWFDTYKTEIDSVSANGLLSYRKSQSVFNFLHSSSSNFKSLRFNVTWLNKCQLNNLCLYQVPPKIVFIDGCEVKTSSAHDTRNTNSESWLSFSCSSRRHKLPEIKAGTAPVNWSLFRSSCIFPNSANI